MRNVLDARHAAAAIFLPALLLFAAHSHAAGVYISEFMAENTIAPTDEFGTKPDWIEIHNPDSAPVNLLGYFLTDNINEPRKWGFPNMTLGANARLVVFASG